MRIPEFRRPQKSTYPFWESDVQFPGTKHVLRNPFDSVKAPGQLGPLGPVGPKNKCWAPWDPWAPWAPTP